MTENKRETGVRVPKERHEPAQTDQDASLPKNPRGAGLSQPVNETDETTHQSDQAGTLEGTPESDARGAAAKTQHGGRNDGTSSADPRSLSGKPSGDATFKHTYNGIDRE